MSNLRASIVIQGIDRLTGPFRRMARGFKHATEEMDKAGKKAAKSMEGVKNVSQSFKNVGQSMALRVTAPIVGFGILSLRSAAKFEMAMNKVSVLTNATGGDMKRLDDQARLMGKTTQFSASQAADAMGFLAMAGFDVNKIIGSMPGTLQLAAAANMELGRAADIVSNVLTGYGLEADQIGRVNDVLVKSFTSANTDLGQFAEAMKIAGPVAKGMGMSFEETSAVIGIMGNAGFQASLAGTALRGTLSRLANPAKDAQRALGKLGIKQSDIMQSDGSLRSLTEIIRVLGEKGAGASELLEIFGERAGPAMTAVVSQGADAVAELTKKLAEAGGTAKHVADAQMKGAIGETRKLQSAFEGLQLAIADSGLLEAFTSLVRGLTEWMSSLSESSKTALKWGTIIAGIAAMIAPVLMAIGSLGLAISGLSVAGAALGALSLPILAIVAAVAAVGAAAYLIYDNWVPIADFFKDLWDGVLERFNSVTNAIRSGISSITNLVPNSVKGMFGIDAPSGQSLKQPAPIHFGGAQSARQFSGDIRISIDSEGRPKIRELKSDSKDVGITVDTGLAMAGG